MMNNTMSRLLLTGFCIAALGGAVPASAEARGAFSPAAPVQMTYELPEQLPASGPLDVTVELATPLPGGALIVEVIDATGLTVLDGGTARYAVDGKPVRHCFHLLLGSAAERVLTVSVTVDGVLGPLSRTYRLDFSTEAERPQTSAPAFKFLPATRPQ
jgi:hypothetical protein